MQATVIGAGVIGLTCATVLAEAGAEVTVLARDLPMNTTSAIAAALWHPYRVYPLDRVMGWANTTYRVFAEMAKSEPSTGVRMMPGVELRRERSEAPWWAASIANLTRADPATLPAGYSDGWCLVSPVIDMSVYLLWLEERARRAGVTLRQRELSDWPVHTDAIVNATGLDGVPLHGDSTGYPIRGQIVYLEQLGLSRWWLDEAGPTYIVPRLRDVVVGGTEEIGSQALAPDRRTASEILARAAEIEPKIAKAKVLGHGVGLRPARPTVRLEREDRAGASPIVHCYGHGGGGVTLSWGCAEEVAGLLS